MVSLEEHYYAASIAGAVATVLVCVGTLIYYAADVCRWRRERRATTQGASTPILLTNLPSPSLPPAGPAPAQSPAPPPPQADLSGIVEAVDGLSAAIKDQTDVLRDAIDRITNRLDNSNGIRRQAADVQANVTNNALDLVDDVLVLINRVSAQLAGTHIG
jgi:hypothetical protein